MTTELIFNVLPLPYFFRGNTNLDYIVIRSKLKQFKDRVFENLVIFLTVLKIKNRRSSSNLTEYEDRVASV